jgi:hypothetical protein
MHPVLTTNYEQVAMIEKIFRVISGRNEATKLQRSRMSLLLLSTLKDTKELFRMKLTKEGLDRQNRNIKRIALLDPVHAPWAKLYDSRDDAALITVTGFDHAAFQHMLELF